MHPRETGVEEGLVGLRFGVWGLGFWLVGLKMRRRSALRVVRLWALTMWRGWHMVLHRAEGTKRTMGGEECKRVRGRVERVETGGEGGGGPFMVAQTKFLGLAALLLVRKPNIDLFLF
jgi:hypothetical protein